MNGKLIYIKKIYVSIYTCFVLLYTNKSTGLQTNKKTYIKTYDRHLELLHLVRSLVCSLSLIFTQATV